MTGPRYRPPRLLDPGDHIEAFRCRSEEQTAWLRLHSRQAHATGTAKVLVVTVDDGPEVVAFYGWCMASVRIDAMPTRLRKGAGRYPQPVVLLARLGVSIDHEGRGLGAGLLTDVITRTAQLGGQIDCRGLVIHAETEEAVAFYRHLLPGLEDSPTDDLHLVLPLKDILRSIRDVGTNR